MISQRQSNTLEPVVDTAPAPAPGLTALVSAVRDAVAKHSSWADTAELVASALERHFPSPRILTAERERDWRRERVCSARRHPPCWMTPNTHHVT
jgi:hypothetical protein